MDPYDINWEELSYAELCVLEDLVKGELKRREFGGHGAVSALPAAKRVAHIAFDLRIASQSLRNLCSELKTPKT